MSVQYHDIPNFYQYLYHSPTPSKNIARELMELELQTEGLLKVISE